MLSTSPMKSAGQIDAPDGLNACLSRTQKLLVGVLDIELRLGRIADNLGGGPREASAGKIPEPRPDTAVSVFVARQIEEDLRDHMLRMNSLLERIERDIA